MADTKSKQRASAHGPAEERGRDEQRERLADIGAVTTKIVHDLGNPLAGVSMQAQLMQRRITQNPDRPARDLAGCVDLIVTEVRRLDDLIKDFLEFAHQQRVRLESVAVGPLLRQVIEAWEPAASARDVVLTLEMAADVPPLHVDGSKVRRVLDHLVRNAIEAVDGSPRGVSVQAAPRKRHVRITVTDTGCGVPEDLEPFRLFETTKPEGSGLGLSIAKQIVTAHDGTIGFERLGTGTSFYVDLPTRGAHRSPV